MKTQLTKIALTIAFGIFVTSCATTSSTETTSPTVRLGKVVSKNTIITQNARNNPVNVGVGFGGGSWGGLGWGVGVGLGQLLSFGKTTDTTYQYTIKMNESESIVMQDKQNYDINTCVLVQELANKKGYPKLEVNPACALPIQSGTTSQ